MIIDGRKVSLEFFLAGDCKVMVELHVRANRVKYMWLKIYVKDSQLEK